MKKIGFIGILFITSFACFSQNLKVLENKSMNVYVGFGGLEGLETKLGFDEKGIEAEIKQILRSNALKVNNDKDSNLAVLFIIDAMLMDTGTIIYTSEVSVIVVSAFSLIQDRFIQEEWVEKDEFQLENFNIYQKRYLGSAGSLKYNSIRESLISLTKQFVEDYFDDLD